MSHDKGRFYTASLSISALTTAATEIMSLLPSSLSRVELHKLELGQTSTSTLTPARVELFRGSTAGGSTGSAITPVNRDGWSNAPASTSAVTGNSTTPNSTASGSVHLHIGTFDVDSGQFCWEPCPPPVLDISQRFWARFTPLTTAALTGLTAVLTFREVGKIPSA